MRRYFITLILLLCFTPFATGGETMEEWIALGARIHGAFGPFIPVGIRVGLDAVERLKVAPRDLTVVYYPGKKPPCPCVADGVMLATHTSPGQGTFSIAPENAPEGTMAVVLVRDRKSGGTLRYSISDDWLPKILGWMKNDPPARYDAAMDAEDLFQVEKLK